LQRREGDRIDSHDFVVRQKRCQETLKHPEIYGTRKDAVCGSWTIAQQLPDVGAGEVWVFLDSRHANVSDEEIERAKFARIDRGLCDYWNRLYRMRRKPYTKPPGVVGDGPEGHPHLSAGFHSIIYAAHFLKPKTIVLAGFDNIQSGSFTWSITRGPEWNRYPDHNWPTEHEMLGDIRKEFGVEVGFL